MGQKLCAISPNSRGDSPSRVFKISPAIKESIRWASQGTILYDLALSMIHESQWSEPRDKSRAQGSSVEERMEALEA